VAAITITDIDYIYGGWPFPVIGANVNVSGLGSTTGCPGGMTDYRWDWTNDGSWDDYGGTSFHTYATGTFTLRLQVRDACNKSSIATATISIP